MPSTTESTRGQTLSEAITGTIFQSNGELLVDETQVLVETSLKAMRANLAANPAWRKAPEPTDDFLLMFLRAETFDADKAAQRYRQFWKLKVSLWGEDKAHLPPSTGDCLKALKTGYFQHVPGVKDRDGRQVFLTTESVKNQRLSRNERSRAIWYVLLTALEDVETQRRGACFVISLKGSKFSSVEIKFNLIGLESLQNALPLRLGTISVVYPPSFFRILWNSLCPFMSKKFRQKVRVVPEANTLRKLEEVMDVAGIPEPMGPKTLDFQSWVEQRVGMETPQGREAVAAAARGASGVRCPASG